MTSLIGKNLRTNHNNKEQGFTLLELALVAIIILALATLSTPLFKRTYDDLQLTSSVKEFTGIVRFLRERAVLERKNYRLNIDVGKRSYQAFAEAEDEQKEFKEQRSIWGRTFRLPETIAISTETEAIYFYTDGTVTPAIVYINNKEGKCQAISIEEEAGLTTVYDYKKE